MTAKVPESLDRPLEGLKILVLDDELLAALDLAHMIRDLGGIVVGPVGTLGEAEKLAKETVLDGAILDVKLNESTSLPLAEQLIDGGIPVILATGYGSNMLPARFEKTPKLNKPYGPEVVRSVTQGTFAR